jgi:pimeloyl-ACP methyl ester carboxylesterase
MDEGRITANGVDFAYLSAGSSTGTSTGADQPLALCLHGFPDTAWTWRHLLPELASAGYRAVAPFLRGYAPTSVPADGRYQLGALASDAIALHAALGGDERAVLIGHDWGAMTTYTAASYAPDKWRRVVVANVPPLGAMGNAFFDFEQIKRSFYMFFFQTAFAVPTVAMNDMAFIEGLWRDWSPGYDATFDLAKVKDALRDAANLAAAIGYYRAMFDPSLHDPALADVQAASAAVPPQPTLYLHGEDDGCLDVSLAGDVESMLSPGSRFEKVKNAGHFLPVEQPAMVNRLILEFLDR